MASLKEIDAGMLDILEKMLGARIGAKYSVDMHMHLFRLIFNPKTRISVQEACLLQGCQVVNCMNVHRRPWHTHCWQTFATRHWKLRRLMWSCLQLSTRPCLKLMMSAVIERPVEKVGLELTRNGPSFPVALRNVEDRHHPSWLGFRLRRSQTWTKTS